MDAIYPVAMVVMAAAVAFNLFLTITVIRRLRTEPQATTLPVPRTSLPVPDFEAATEDGTAISTDDLVREDDVVVGFFSSSCSTCARQLPEFSELVAHLPRGRAVTVVTGNREEALRLFPAVTAETVLVHEDDYGPIAKAFNIEGYPTYLRIEAGRIVLTANHHRHLPWSAR
jgi:peroxiredoxin